MSNFESIVNYLNLISNTNIKARGKIDHEINVFEGLIIGNSVDELTKFIRSIANITFQRFESINFMGSRIDPTVFFCEIKFELSRFNLDNYIYTQCPYCDTYSELPAKYSGVAAQCLTCSNTFVVGLIRNTEIKTTKKTNSDEIIHPPIDISDVCFISTNHTRFNNQETKGETFLACNRKFLINEDSSIKNSYIVTLYNLDGVNPMWGDNIQMAPKRMKVVKIENDTIVLRGFGNDPMLTNRPPQVQENFGVCIKHANNEISEIALLYHDRNVKILFNL